MKASKAVLAIALGVGLAGCYVDPGPIDGASGHGAAGGASQSVPTLVFVDPDRTLAATPGQGVGVFVQYQSGGRWQIAWSCDTSLTGESCRFRVDVDVASGSISDAQGSIAQGDPVPVSLDGPRTISVASTTTTSIDSVSFDATPGVAITIDASMNGRRAGQYLFFVQDGQVNGGYAGTLSDPLTFEPSSA